MQQTDKNADYYMIKALEAFRKKIIIISPEFKILVANGHDFYKHKPDVVGKLCYEVLSGRTSPCNNCPAMEVNQTHKLVLRKPQEGFSCLYSYPVFSGEKIEALVILDVKFPNIEELGEKLHRSNAFLRNLILSAVDGVIAADKSGKIRMFNDAAAKITGYSIDETINKLNIWDIYVDDDAREVMKKLRSDEYGGKGKVKAYQQY
ncbi:MAG: PAS domain S-box protein [Deltaproteobacteria bacterium]|nr:PAS domain S-box protein [Deltaproteobacteria bacterium]